MRKERNFFADTSFLIDFIRGRDGTREVFPEASTVVTSSLCLFELGRKVDFNPEMIENSRVKKFGREDARHAFRIHLRLSSKGEKVNTMDVMIAGQVVNPGIRLLTADSDFRKIEEVDAVYYRDNNLH